MTAELDPSRRFQAVLARLIAPLLLLFALHGAGPGTVPATINAAPTAGAVMVIDDAVEVTRTTRSRRQARRWASRRLPRLGVRTVWRATRALGRYVLRSTRLAPPARRGPPILLM